MQQRLWLAIPIAEDSSDFPPRPKYAINGAATVVYFDAIAYARMEDLDAAVVLSRLPGVHILTSTELAEVKSRAADEVRFPVDRAVDEGAALGLGDALARLFGKMGI